MNRWWTVPVIWLLSQAVVAANFNHRLWDDLLARHIVSDNTSHATTVDYSALKNDRTQLQGYLASLAQVSTDTFNRWPAPEQLAFLINAYNAWTVELILTEYPGLKSIKELGGLFSSPWSKPIAQLLGKSRSLDDIEHTMIRGSDRYKDPRIHFAVNCASIGCPALRPEAYVGSQLEHQLQDQTRLFLADRTRNRLQGTRLEVSPIFKWYREDFENGWRGQDSLRDFFAHYASALGLNEDDLARLAGGDIKLEFTSYDWTLNDIR